MSLMLLYVILFFNFQITIFFFLKMTNYDTPLCNVLMIIIFILRSLNNILNVGYRSMYDCSEKEVFVFEYRLNRRTKCKSR